MIEQQAEQWVDLKEIAKHLSCSYLTAYRMATEGKIPGTSIRNGSRLLWRFKKSIVDAHMMNQGRAA